MLAQRRYTSLWQPAGEFALPDGYGSPPDVLNSYPQQTLVDRRAPPDPPEPSLEAEEELLHVSIPTLLGVAQLLGHALEDRSSISQQQDLQFLHRLQATTSTPLRSASVVLMQARGLSPRLRAWAALQANQACAVLQSCSFV